MHKRRAMHAQSGRQIPFRVHFAGAHAPYNALMKRHWIEYTEKWMPGPLSYWVHIEADGCDWYNAQFFQPPLPFPVPDKGFPTFWIECDGVMFQFASLDELRACIDILSRKLLPTTIRLAQDRGGNVGPSRHWLSKLPLQAKPWRYREKAVKYLARSLADFEREILGTPASASRGEKEKPPAKKGATRKRKRANIRRRGRR